MFAMPGARAFSLAAERASGAVSCGADGAFVGDVPLLQAVGAGPARQWVVRALPELNDELSAQYGLPIDVASKANALALIAAAFNRSDLAMAAIATVQMQFPDPPLTKGRETEEQIGRRALELHRSRLLKFWDPAKHPRTGTPPNPAWFATVPGGDEAPVVVPVVDRRPPSFWPWGKKPFAPGSGTVPPGTEGLPLFGGGVPRLLPPGGAPPAPKAPQGTPAPAWVPPDPKSKLPFMGQSEPQLAPYKQGKTSGIFRAPGMMPIELESGYDGPTRNLPLGTPGFDYHVRSHVEAQAAAIMRQMGISEASLEINNPIICERCEDRLDSMLPPGAKLHIILPGGKIRTFPEIRKAIRWRLMKVQYFNQQDKLDPMHGSAVNDGAQLNQILDMAKSRPPFIAALKADNGFEMSMGISEKLCCVQYSSLDGDPPYLMAMSPDRPLKRGFVEFLLGGTLTPSPARYVIRFDELKEILLHFLETGKPSDAFSWEEFDPEAVSEAAGGHLQWQMPGKPVV